MNRLLDIRVTDARQSMRRTEDALQKAVTRRSAAIRLQNDVRALRVAQQWRSKIDALVRRCEDIYIDMTEASDQEELKRLITGAKDGISEIGDGLTSVEQCVQRLTKNFWDKDQLQYHLGRTRNVLQTKGRQLGAIPKKAGQAGSNARQLLAEVELAKPIWGEHLESIAGMILRDEQMDEGLCEIADQLIGLFREYSPFNETKTFNILGREQAVLRELKNTLYLKFPSWTVWGLPLVVHDFWHISNALVLKDPLMQERLEAVPDSVTLWDKASLQACLADVFATFVAGPAYAFACILLMLDVSSAQDQARAATIFATLDYLAKSQADEPAYAFRGDLRKSWAEACGSDAPVPADAEQIELMRDALLSFMPAELRYNAAGWLGAGDVLQKFLKTKVSVQGDGPPDVQAEIARLRDEIGRLKEVDLRHVLHAAWEVRWGGLDFPGGAENPSADGDGAAPSPAMAWIDDLAKNTAELAKNIRPQNPRRALRIEEENDSSTDLLRKLVTR